MLLTHLAEKVSVELIYRSDLEAQHGFFLGFSLLRKIIWGDFEVRSSRIVASLSEHRDLLDLEANACHTVEARYEKHQQNSHRELVESLEVIKWLSPADTEDHLDKLQRLRTECTGMWFFARAEYVNWVEGTQKLLWVNGIPG